MRARGRRAARTCVALLLASAALPAQDASTDAPDPDARACVDERLLEPDFRAGASSWRLDDAALDEDDDGTPVVRLAAQDGDGWSTMTSPMVPVGGTRRFVLRAEVKLLGFGHRVFASVDAYTAERERLDTVVEKLSLWTPAGAWREIELEFEPPADARGLAVRVDARGGDPTLVRRCSLSPVAPAPTDTGVLGGLTRGELHARADAVFTRLEALRGEAFPTRPLLWVLDRETFAALATTGVPLTGSDARMTEALRMLGAWPRDADDHDVLYQAALGRWAAGSYIVPMHTLLLAADTPVDAVDDLVAHEGAHALDLHGTEPGDPWVPESRDLSLARSAIHEGSACFDQQADAHRHRGLDLDAPEAMGDLRRVGIQRSIAEGLPSFLVRERASLYEIGMRFLRWGADDPTSPTAEGRERITRARDLERGPVSTEQILHPAKYWSDAERDEPRELAPPDVADVLGDGWEETFDIRLGELLLGAFTGAEHPAPGSDPTVPSGWSSPATAGWGGDRLQLHASGEQRVAVLFTAWDTAADAEEFHAALQLPEDAAAARRDDRVVVTAATALVPDDGVADARALAERLLDAWPEEDAGR